MDRPIHDRRVQVDDCAHRKKEQGKKGAWHTRSTARKRICNLASFAEGGCRVERSSRAEIYQRNKQSRPQAQDKERGSSNKTSQTSRSNSEGTATEDKTIIDFLGGGGQNQGSSAGPQVVQGELIDKEEWVKRQMDIGVSESTPRSEESRWEKTTPGNQNIGVRVRFTAPVEEKGGRWER